MKDWTPKVRGDLDLSSLSLSGEEGFVLSRVDGQTSTRELAQLTGLPSERVGEILGNLEEQGAIARVPSMADFVRARPAPSPASESVAAESEERAPPAGKEEFRSLSAPAFNQISEEDLAELEAELGAELEAERESSEAPWPDFGEPTDLDARPADDEGSKPAPIDFDAQTEEVPPPLVAEIAADVSVADANAEPADQGPAVEETVAEAPEAPAAPDEVTEDFTDPELDLREVVEDKEDRNYRKYFETQLHSLPRDDRAEMAKRVSGPHLLALCYDPDPGVVANILENTDAGLQHARLIAEHHRNGVGLEALAKQIRFFKDAQVQRFLLRNVQCGEAVLRRMLSTKALLPIYKINVGRELSERARRAAHQALRRGFSRASADERVALIMKSEGRCLNMLLGLGLDGRTTSLLCSRNFTSAMLVQNFLRWPATPPPILNRIWKQPTVQRTPHLKKMVLRHPNCPTQIKMGKS